MVNIEKFSDDVIAKLNNYVYVYVNGDNEIFYVGRGIGNRAFSHLYETCRDEKSHNIEKLSQIDENTKIYIVHSGMTAEEAMHCETALINLCGYLNPALSNGKEGDRFILGMSSVEEIENTYHQNTVLLENIFQRQDQAAVFAYTKEFYRTGNITYPFFEKLQHENGFRITHIFSLTEEPYMKSPPKILCVVHNKVIRGIFSVESEIDRDYISRPSAFAYVTFEFEDYKTIPEYEKYIGMRIEKQKSVFVIDETDDGRVHLLY